MSKIQSSSVRRHIQVTMLLIEDITGTHFYCSHPSLWKEWIDTQIENELENLCAFHLKLRKLLKDLNK